MYKKIIFITILTFALVGCKNKKATTNYSSNSNTMLLTKVLDNYRENKFQKRTLKASLKVKYKGKTSLPSVTASLRMEKDKVIWLSISKLFFKLGKLKITPDRVQFYNNLDNTYYDGDFSLLSDFLGTEVNFSQVQNILLGEAIFNLNTTDYTIKPVDTNYLFSPKKQAKLFSIFFWLNGNNHRISKQEIHQEKENKLLSVQYNAFEKVNDMNFPKQLYIVAKENDNTNTINIDYKNIVFDLNLNFPFAIPSGYNEIKL